MLNQKNNIFQNINFSNYTSVISDAVKNGIEKYWEQDAKVVSVAINNFRELRQEYLIKNTDFFSSQIKVENHRPVLIRLSKDFIENTLNVTLSSNNPKLRLTDLTPLEIRILNNFCEFLYKRINEVLIPGSKLSLSEKSDKIINIIFLICIKNNICSKIMISVPLDRLNISEIKKQVSFKDEDFLASSSFVKVKAGSSKITIDELKNLSPDDIILLEDSDISYLTLVSGDFKKRFSVKVNPALILNLDNDDDTKETYNEVTMEKNLWDDIQIEISAEFEKVKMTIGELKQITQGQVVDLGSVFDSEISLFVEDKKVAKGELLIINDRYAVKLNEVLATSKTAAPKPQAQNPQPKPQGQPQLKPQPKVQAQNPQKPQGQPQPKPQPKPKVEDEEFDYSDFEK